MQDDVVVRVLGPVEVRAADGWLAGPPQQRWQAERPDTAANALALIARDAIEIVCGPLGPVIHQCEAHGCARMFFRTHGRRRWCSNTCGDRVRVARHYLARKARRPAKASQQPAPGP